MSEKTQREAYELGGCWRVADCVLTTAELDRIVNTDNMTRQEYAAHWIQVERGLQGKPFEPIDTEV